VDGRKKSVAPASSHDVTLDILAPSLPFPADTCDDVNVNSIVVMLHYRPSGGDDLA